MSSLYNVNVIISGRSKEFNISASSQLASFVLSKLVIQLTYCFLIFKHRNARLKDRSSHILTKNVFGKLSVPGSRIAHKPMLLATEESRVSRGQERHTFQVRNTSLFWYLPPWSIHSSRKCWSIPSNWFCDFFFFLSEKPVHPDSRYSKPKKLEVPPWETCAG